MQSPLLLCTLVVVVLCTGLQRAQAKLTPAQEAAMLAAHNNARATASPTPCTQLTNLTYSPALARVAQAYSDRCIYEHNANRTTDAGGAFRYVGENLYLSVSHSPASSDPVASVTAWDSEKVDYDLATLVCTPGKMCGHYTQLVWNGTTQVGCGATMCKTANLPGQNFNPTRFPHAYLVTCNYGVGGNFRGQSPYETCPQTGAAPGLHHESNAGSAIAMLVFLVCLFVNI
ncbi:peptidase inhibitor 16-like [Sycon ciliatum]|uniref:peptidase inhibitor 16-like n=1 Tax=Sycon ciliatum TaxID=27933 RepID=UPI0020AB132F|eukprot:scpid82746/ scgid15337/ Peptidase inhibitor 16